MHDAMFAAFDTICRREKAGGDVLEIGASADHKTLLGLPSLSGASSRTGIDLEGPVEGDGFRILKGNANSMPELPDKSFDVILSNSVFEHDASFWLSLAEIRRVARPGALVVIGVPGYAKMGSFPLRRIQKLVGMLPFLPARMRSDLRATSVAAATLGLHYFPSDYYRFSEHAVREVFLAGMTSVEVTSLLFPPRFIGSGRMP